MEDNKINLNDLILDLKIISKIKPNNKLIIENNKIYIDDSYYFASILRYFYNFIYYLF